MIPTVEQVRQMSVDARGGAGVPASRPVASSKSSRVGKAPQVARVGESSGEKTGVWLVPVAIIVLIVALTLAGVLVIRGMRRAHPTSAPAVTFVVSGSAADGGEWL